MLPSLHCWLSTSPILPGKMHYKAVTGLNDFARYHPMCIILKRKLTLLLFFFVSGLRQRKCSLKMVSLLHFLVRFGGSSNAIILLLKVLNSLSFVDKIIGEVLGMFKSHGVPYTAIYTGLKPSTVSHYNPNVYLPFSVFTNSFSKFTKPFFIYSN